MLILALVVHPSAAILNSGNFTPVSRTAGTSTGPEIYTIRPGDTLWTIAKRHGVSVDALMLSNQLGEQSILKIDQKIHIPSSNQLVHIVTKGDTVWGIARKYRTSVDQIAALNKGMDPESLNIGDRLNIPAAAGNRELRAAAYPSRSLTMIMLWPVVGKITSGYGWRKSGFHHGLDIAAKKGTPIYAACAGTVSFVGIKPVYGRTVIIDHADGKRTLYAHTQKIYVKNGENVKGGEIIAAVGTSGVTTGPHLHFEVRYDNKTINPLKFLRQ
jgi:murein DD-endopeptidase MepM/ murein hydrolase activator NlpD